MENFQADRGVIDGLPEAHSTRLFAAKYQCRVFMNFFKRLSPSEGHNS